MTRVLEYRPHDALRAVAALGAALTCGMAQAATLGTLHAEPAIDAPWFVETTPASGALNDNPGAASGFRASVSVAARDCLDAVADPSSVQLGRPGTPDVSSWTTSGGLRELFDTLVADGFSILSKWGHGAALADAISETSIGPGIQNRGTPD